MGSEFATASTGTPPQGLPTSLKQCRTRLGSPGARNGRAGRRVRNLRLDLDLAGLHLLDLGDVDLENAGAELRICVLDVRLGRQLELPLELLLQPLLQVEGLLLLFLSLPLLALDDE